MLVLNMQKIKSEEQFGNIFVGSPSLQKITSSSKFYMAKELKTSLGVPDYVLLSDADYAKLQNFAHEYPEIEFSGRYAAVVSYIYRNVQANIDAISSFLKENRSQVVKSLEKLEMWGVVTFQDENRLSVVINASFNIPELESIAIELKLSSWEKALWQAIRNSNQFASSYIVMPSDKLALLRSKADLFLSNNVSTAVFDIESLELTHITKQKNALKLSGRHYIETFSSILQNLPKFEEVAV